MATRTEVELSCDLPGKHDQYVETRSFALDGQTYEIETCERHALDKVVAPFVKHARRVTLRQRKYKVRDQASRARSKEIRRWWSAEVAAGRGGPFKEPLEVRGRIPDYVIKRYKNRV
jgi:hypothetical protein